MTFASLVPLAFSVSLALIAFAIALEASPADLLSLARRPGLVLRSVLAMNVLLPIFALWLVATFHLDPAVKIAVVVLALSPVPPIRLVRHAQAGGSASFAVGLLATVAMLSIVVLPLGTLLCEEILGETAALPLARIARTVLAGVLVPLLLGGMARALAPAIAAKTARPLWIAGTVLLIVALVPVLIARWGAIVAVVSSGTLLALAALTAVGVAIGHLLGGPDPYDRTVLALATGARHPGLALSIAGATFPDAEVVAAILFWHLVLAGLVSGPYLELQARRREARGVDA